MEETNWYGYIMFVFLIGLLIFCAFKINSLESENERLTAGVEYLNYSLVESNKILDKRWTEIGTLKDTLKSINNSDLTSCVYQLQAFNKTGQRKCMLNVKGNESISFFVREEGNTECDMLEKSCINSAYWYGVNCTWQNDSGNCRCYSG